MLRCTFVGGGMGVPEVSTLRMLRRVRVDADARIRDGVEFIGEPSSMKCLTNPTPHTVFRVHHWRGIGERRGSV